MRIAHAISVATYSVALAAISMRGLIRIRQGYYGEPGIAKSGARIGILLVRTNDCGAAHEAADTGQVAIEFALAGDAPAGWRAPAD